MGRPSVVDARRGVLLQVAEQHVLAVLRLHDRAPDRTALAARLLVPVAVDLRDVAALDLDHGHPDPRPDHQQVEPPTPGRPRSAGPSGTAPPPPAAGRAAPPRRRARRGAPRRSPARAGSSGARRMVSQTGHSAQRSSATDGPGLPEGPSHRQRPSAASHPIQVDKDLAPRHGACAAGTADDGHGLVALGAETEGMHCELGSAFDAPDSGTPASAYSPGLANRSVLRVGAARHFHDEPELGRAQRVRRRLAMAPDCSSRTLSEFVNDSLRLALAPSERSAAAAVSLPVFGGTGLRPGVDLEDKDGLASLLDGKAATRAAG